MADEVKDTPAPAAIPAAEPVSPPAPVETPVAPAPSPTEPVVEAQKSEPASPQTLLAQEKKIEVQEQPKVEEKPAEIKAEEKPAETKTEEKPAEQKVEVPVEIPKYELKLPENFQVDEAKMGEFTKTLGDFEVSAKVSHEEVQKLGQQFLERHVQEMERYTKSLTDAWTKQANDWKDSFLKSPEFTNRTDTVLNSALDAINVFGGDEKQKQEFRELMESSKIGNHPAMIRLLSNVMLAKQDPKPLAAPTIATAARRSKIETMYGKKKSG